MVPTENRACRHENYYSLIYIPTIIFIQWPGSQLEMFLKFCLVKYSKKLDKKLAIAV